LTVEGPGDCVQVLVLSEGLEMYFGPPSEVTDWFQGKLGYDYNPAIDGSVSDWVMDLVSVGFAKPEPYASRFAPRAFLPQKGCGRC
jgi:hypothetical protein